jgi:hypothetical protein
MTCQQSLLADDTYIPLPPLLLLVARDYYRQPKRKRGAELFDLCEREREKLWRSNIFSKGALGMIRQALGIVRKSTRFSVLNPA